MTSPVLSGPLSRDPFRSALPSSVTAGAAAAALPRVSSDPTLAILAAARLPLSRLIALGLSLRERRNAFEFARATGGVVLPGPDWLALAPSYGLAGQPPHDDGGDNRLARSPRCQSVGRRPRSWCRRARASPFNHSGM